METSVEEQLEKALEYLEDLNKLWSWSSIDLNEERWFIEVQDFLKSHKMDYNKAEW